MPSSLRRRIVAMTSATIFGREALARLVEEHQPGRAEEGAGDRDHLHLAAGEVLGLAMHEVVEGREDLASTPSALHGAEARALLRRSTRLLRDRQRRAEAPVVRHPADAGARDAVRRPVRHVRAVEADAAALRPASGRGSSAASWSCRRRSGRAARTTSPGATAKRDVEQHLRLAVEGMDAVDASSASAPPAIAGSERGRAAATVMQRPRFEACTQGFCCSASGVPLRDHLAPMHHRDAVGEPEQELHVVLDRDDREAPLQRAGSARRGAATPSEPRPEVGSSRNSTRGRCASATAISSARRSP